MNYVGLYESTPGIMLIQNIYLCILFYYEIVHKVHNKNKRKK